jgi:ABC-type transport system involved in cytochrome c biogenesis permease subunit
MAVKYTIQGLLIYEAMGFYVLALLLGPLKYRRLSLGAYGLGFAAAATALVYRGIAVAHFPLQNLFEIFLFLGALPFPVTLLSMKFLNSKDIVSDIVLGIILLIPAGFIFSAQPQYLPPALQSILFVPHVLVYMLAYVILAKAALWGGRQLFSRGDYERSAYQLVCLAFPLLTLGLILGSVWGKLAWGDYWNWDPKEMWSLATWLVYVGYLHFRSRFSGYKRTCSAWLIAGFVFIVITLLWVNLSRIFAGLHSYT